MANLPKRIHTYLRPKSIHCHLANISSSGISVRLLFSLNTAKQQLTSLSTGLVADIQLYFYNKMSQTKTNTLIMYTNRILID